MTGRYKQRERGGTVVHEAHPHRNWRCTVWPQGGDWIWEARRFGARGLHVSGECGRLDHAKRVALAAALALAVPGRL